MLAAAYKATRRGGRTVTVGLPNPAEMLSIPAVSLVGDGKTLMGSYMGSAIPARDVPRYIALWRPAACRWNDCSPASVLCPTSTG